MMKHVKVLSVIPVLLSLASYGQDQRYNELLQIAKEKAGIVVSSQPMTVELNPWVLKHHDPTHSLLTDSLISQIAEAIKHADTTEWTSKEFSRTVVIRDRRENLNTSKLLKEWGVVDKAERKKYRHQLNRWTNTVADERPVNYLSRPVMTKDNTYGLIAYDLVTHGLCCGGQVILYKYESGNWKELGPIYTWKH